MKKVFFKFLLSAATVAIICNCGDDVLTTGPEVDYSAYIVQETSYIYNDFYITETGIVLDKSGNQIGTADINNGIIYDLNGNTSEQGIDFGSLTVVHPPVVTSDAWVLSADQTYVIYPNGVVTDATGLQIATIVINTDPETGTSVGDIVSLDGTPIFTDVEISNLKVFNANSSVNQDPIITSSATEPPVPESSAGEIPFPDPGISSAVQPPQSSDSQQPTPSSSSSAKSSSSSAKSSSSVKPSSSSAKSSSSSAKSSSSSKPVGGCPNIQVKSGGKSGSGWATRYWDCCKPHCSVQNNTSYHSRQCTNKGKTESTDWGGQSVCTGGQMMACTSQIPFTIDGCDDMGFAFAAVPASDGGSCGKCFQLTFTGNGKYVGNANGAQGDQNTNAIKGKKLIIMTTNIGGDVSQGQFDIMIPGGGVGMFNGCSSMGWGNMGKQYGGLLSDCEEEVGYSGNLLKKRTECLTNKCNSVFSNDSQAKEGCLFLANFMQAAGNPMHNYVEVECPEVLKQRY